MEDLHGVTVADPYRWLEAPDAAEVRAWVDAQNSLTAAVLDGYPERPALRERIAALWRRPRRGVPWRRGGHWFQRRNDGTREQDVIHTAPAGQHPHMAPDDEAWRVLVDPDPADGDDALVAVGEVAASRDGTLLAYALSERGSDWMRWLVVDVETGDRLPDEVPWAKFARAAWLPDGSGFVYGGYDPPADGTVATAANRDHRLRLHRLGTDARDDPVVHERPDQPEWGFAPTVSHDGRLLVITVWHGTSRDVGIHLAPIDGGEIGDVRGFLPPGHARYEPVGVLDDRLVVLTDDDAERGRVVAIPIDDPSPGGWDELIAESGDRLEQVRLVGTATAAAPGSLVALRLHHARHRVDIHDTDGRHLTTAAVGQAGTVTQMAGGPHDTRIHLAVATFTSPARVVACDLSDTATAEIEESWDPPAISTPAPLTVEQVVVSHHVGRDADEPPVDLRVFLVHREDVTPGGTVPTLLYGYGGFDIPVTPRFDPAWRTWVEAGGLLAVACLRGGGEYGRAWHEAGRLADKQHVFDDCLAVAEWLVDDGGWTGPEQLGLTGRSNGGLLAGACLTQRPDLFGACVPEVGVLDMLRFHHFTIGWAWASDYGTAEEAEEFAWLRAYSPLHAVTPGTCYPPTLVTTGISDDRVVPAHSFKFAAALQHAQGCPRPAMLRVETGAGHGAGTPVGRQIEERSDVLAFLAHHCDLQPPT